MKTIEEYRNYKLDEFGHMLRYPGMHMIHEEVLWCWFDDMAFIDGRTDEWQAERERLSAQGRLAATGANGALRNLRARNRLKQSRDWNFNYTDEVMSIFAEVAWRLGYLNLHRQLTEPEWHALTSGLDRYKINDWHQAEVIDLLGPPSLRVDSTILCYAGPDWDTPWICFDFEFCGEGYLNFAPHESSGFGMIDGKPGENHPERRNPLLRKVRFQGRLEPALVFTEYEMRTQSRD